MSSSSSTCKLPQHLDIRLRLRHRMQQHDAFTARQLSSDSIASTASSVPDELSKPSSREASPSPSRARSVSMKRAPPSSFLTFSLLRPRSNTLPSKPAAALSVLEEEEEESEELDDESKAEEMHKAVASTLMLGRLMRSATISGINYEPRLGAHTRGVHMPSRQRCQGAPLKAVGEEERRLPPLLKAPSIVIDANESEDEEQEQDLGSWC